MHTLLASITALAFLTVIPPALGAPADNTVVRRDECTFTAYSGRKCDGEAGNVDVVSSNRCILAEGRHSFSLGDGCVGTTDVKFYTGEGCPGDAYIDYQYPGPGCYTVNTGAHWGSSLVSVSEEGKCTLKFQASLK